MRNKSILSLVIFAFALGLPQPVSAVGPDDLEALGWLAGCWEGEGGGGRNQECWMAPEGGMMLAVSRVISERGPPGKGAGHISSPAGRQCHGW